jgi:hypothetical protein
VQHAPVGVGEDLRIGLHRSNVRSRHRHRRVGEENVPEPRAGASSQLRPLCEQHRIVVLQDRSPGQQPAPDPGVQPQIGKSALSSRGSDAVVEPVVLLDIDQPRIVALVKNDRASPSRSVTGTLDASSEEIVSSADVQSKALVGLLTEALTERQG